MPNKLQKLAVSLYIKDVYTSDFFMYTCFLYLFQKGKPSADIKNNVVNVLYAYCFICRLYNGDHLSFPTEASKV